MATESSTRIALPHGTFYRGEQLNGKPHGQGREETEDGELIYKGGWKNGLRDGVGKDYRFAMIHPILDVLIKGIYEGEWKDGKSHGEGKCYRLARDEMLPICEGQWSKGKLHGEGKVYDSVIFTIFYEGGFWNGLRHGQGKQYLSGELSYEGGFSEGSYCGRGKSYINQKTPGEEGIWFKDEFLGSQPKLVALWDEFVGVKQELAREKTKNYKVVGLSISVAEENISLREKLHRARGK